MFGLEFDENGSGIDANFTSVAYLRKGIINGGPQEISCNIDAVSYTHLNNWRVLKYLRAYNPKATGFQLDIL